MFKRKKKNQPGIDPIQKEMIEKAQRRIRQQRGLFTHLVVFIVATIGLLIISQVLIEQEPISILNVQWWIWIVFIWLLFLIYHAFKVFITNRLLGPEWEQRQLDRLVKKQQERIAELEQKIAKKHPLPAVTASVLSQDDKVITMIAAAGANNELGIEGDLPWHLPNDFKRFKSLTTGHHIIMGRKTFETFPKPLPNRTHVILTRDPNYTTNHGIVVHNLQDALAVASEDNEAFIIGGGEIYKLGLEVADRIELTRVHGSFTVDTYFPEFDEKQWKLIRTESHPADEKHQYAYDFETWEKIKKA